jgi:DnaJ-class molecular chaperone
VTPDQSDDERSRCSACRGSGQVISTEGGEPRSVRCPWCDGTGRFIPGHDAQAARHG